MQRALKTRYMGKPPRAALERPFRVGPARAWACAVLVLISAVARSPATEGTAFNLPRMIPVGMKMTKSLQLSKDWKVDPAAALPKTVTLRRSKEVTEKVEEFSDGRKAVAYLAASYYVSQDRDGITIVDLRLGGIDPGMGPFDDLEWIDHPEVKESVSPEGLIVLERSPFRCEIDPVTKLPKAATGPMGSYKYA